MKVVGIVQARMGSARLPNKVMLWLHGYPVIEWIFRRAAKSRLIDELVFAIPQGSKDDVLESFLSKKNATLFRGDEEDVVKRLHDAGRAFDATHIVRICADNPFICPKTIDDLINFFNEEDCDYAYNHIPRNNKYPDGIGAEITSMELMTIINDEARMRSQREHVFNFIWDNREKFKISTFDPPDRSLWYPEIRLDIDTYDDYRKFIERNLSPDLDSREIISLMKEPS